MKKLIAISVVFALVLGAAFAQPSLGGNFQIGTKLLAGQTENEVDQVELSAGGLHYDAIRMDASFGDANAGGIVRFLANKSPSNWYYMWWRPIPQLRIALGQNDGEWGHSAIADWGYDAEAKAVGVAQSMYSGEFPPLSKVATPQGNKAWSGGINNALWISLYPIDGLQFNVGVPVGNGDYNTSAQNLYSHLFLDVKYVLEDVGTVKLAAQLTPLKQDRYIPSESEVNGSAKPENFWKGKGDGGEFHETPSIWAAFHLTALEGVGAELGIGWKFPYTTQEADFVKKSTTVGLITTESIVNEGGVGYGGLPQNTKVNSALNIGLGLEFNSGDFGVKARAGFVFGQSVALADPSKSWEMTRESNFSSKTFDEVKLGYKQANYMLASNKYQKVMKNAAGDNEVVEVYGLQEKKAEPFQWGLNVAPSYKIGNVKVFLNMGIGMKLYGEQELIVLDLDKDGNPQADGDYTKTKKIKVSGAQELIYSKGTTISSASEYEKINDNLKEVKFDVDWFINPYIQMPAGGGSFYAGIKLYTDGTRLPVKFAYNKVMGEAGISGTEATDFKSNKYQLKWEIPIGWNWYF